MTTNNPAKEIQDLEREVSTYTIQIASIERKLAESEIKASALIEQWSIDKDDPEKQLEARLREMEELNSKEEELQIQYQHFLGKKDSHLKLLRSKYVLLIKQQQTPSKRDSSRRPEGEKAKLTASLQKSSILSGTSLGAYDFVDFRNYFTSWDIDIKDIQMNIIELPWTKREGLSRGGTCLLMNNVKEVYVKEFDKSIDIAELKEISMRYSTVSQKVSHQNLLTPIGRWGADKVTPVKILLELAKIPAVVGQEDWADPSLAGVLEKKSIKFSVKKKVEIARTICEALSWLHSKEIMHYRLKPSNVLFTMDWKVKVTDYALTFPNYFPKDQTRNKQHWFKSKQVHYSAPEAINSFFKINDKARQDFSGVSDVWSYGMVLFALFEETEPFSDAKYSNFDQIATVLCSDGPLLVSHLPKLVKCKSKTLQNLLDECFKPIPYNRKPFAEILKMHEGKVFDKIYQELALLDDTKMNIISKAEKADKAKKLQTSSPSRSPNDFTWADIRSSFFSSSIPSKKTIPLEERCVMLVLGVSAQSLASTLNEKHNPYETRLTSQAVKSILGNIENFDSLAFHHYCTTLVSKPWFHGLLGRAEGENAINSARDKKGTKHFLVRISANNGYTFTLTYPMEKNNHLILNNLTLALCDYETGGLIAYVENFAKKNSLVALSQPADLQAVRNQGRSMFNRLLH